MLFRPHDIDSSIQELLDTYQDNWGELHYVVYSPVETSSIGLPGICTMREVLLESDVLVPPGDRQPEGQLIEVSDFLGDYLERQQQQISSGESTGFYACRGYEFAFFAPPYGLNFEFVEALDIFTCLNAYFFGDLRDDNLQIAEWDCTILSDFFIKEWWDFCWTVWSKEKAWLVVVYGTSTD